VDHVHVSHALARQLLGQRLHRVEVERAEDQIDAPRLHLTDLGTEAVGNAEGAVIPVVDDLEVADVLGVLLDGVSGCLRRELRVVAHAVAKDAIFFAFFILTISPLTWRGHSRQTEFCGIP
jgi:hypothetical protein